MIVAFPSAKNTKEVCANYFANKAIIEEYKKNYRENANKMSFRSEEDSFCFEVEKVDKGETLEYEYHISCVARILDKSVKRLRETEEYKDILESAQDKVKSLIARKLTENDMSTRTKKRVKKEINKNLNVLEKLEYLDQRTKVLGGMPKLTKYYNKYAFKLNKLDKVTTEDKYEIAENAMELLNIILKQFSSIVTNNEKALGENLNHYQTSYMEAITSDYDRIARKIRENYLLSLEWAFKYMS